LAVSFSSTDYVGHQFSVNSVEIEDTYLRMDQLFAELFSFLDKQVGKGQYTIFLTADHGAAHNPLFIMDKKGNAGYFAESNTRRELNNLLQKKFGQENLVYSLKNYQVHFNYKLINEHQLDEDAIRKETVRFF